MLVAFLQSPPMARREEGALLFSRAVVVRAHCLGRCRLLYFFRKGQAPAPPYYHLHMRSFPGSDNAHAPLHCDRGAECNVVHMVGVMP